MLPDSERFNRGGMSLRELVSRINSSGAAGCIVISLYKGNPGSIQFISSPGEALLTLKLESAMLRREINTHRPLRVDLIRAIVIEPEHNDSVNLLADTLSTLLELEVIESIDIEPLGKKAKNQVVIRLLSHGRSKVTWTFLEMANGVEVGPRVKVHSVIIDHPSQGDNDE